MNLRIKITDTFSKTVKQKQNRVKQTHGFSRKEIGRPTNKYQENECWKRAKNVQMQRASRIKNAFDASENLLHRKENWPYENGLSEYLAEIRQQNPLGAGW